MDHEAFGRTHRYFPLVKKEEYGQKYVKQFLGNYFDGSFRKMMSFFSRSGELDLKDIDALLKENQPNKDDV